MSRIAPCLCAAFVVIGAGVADAQEPQQEWLRFFRGEWKYEWSELGMKGTAKYIPAAKQCAVIARFQSDAGERDVELIGWRSDTKTMVFTGFGSAGNFWRAEYGKVSRNRLEGSLSGSLPDGRLMKGSVALERVDDDTFKGYLKGTIGGEEATDVATFSRTKKE